MSEVIVSGADTYFFSVNEVGLLSAFGGPITDIARLWTQSLGGLSRGDYQLEAMIQNGSTSGVVARTPRLGRGTITFIEAASGETRWSHGVPSEEVKSMRALAQVRAPDGETTHLLRYDREASADTDWSPDSCEVIHSLGIRREAWIPVPQTPVLRRFVTALHPQDGRCLWHSRLEPTNVCSSPGYQDISVVDQVVYVTESTGLTAIDTDTGGELARIDLGQVSQVWAEAVVESAPLVRVMY